MPEVSVAEVSPARFEQSNAMCVPPSPDAADVLPARSESAEALQRASAMGLRVFGAFLDSEPVGRLELSPIGAAPVPLTGQGVWVIRCIWVLDNAKGLGLGKRLMERALDSVGTEPVAVLTYDDWMPPAFFEKYGFREVQRQGEAILLVRSGGTASGEPTTTEAAAGDVAPGGSTAGEPAQGEPPRGSTSGESPPGHQAPGQPVPGELIRRAHSQATTVSLAPLKPSFELSPEYVRVDAVYTPRCPWRIVNARRRLGAARELSDRVVTYEHRVYNREDALRLGEEYIYVDGEPLFGGPVTREVFLQAVTERLRGKGLILHA